MLYGIQLDISHEATDEDLKEFAEKYECEFKLIEEFGPAGGNPVYEFTSKSFENVQRLCEEHFGEDNDYFVDDIYPIEEMTF